MTLCDILSSNRSLFGLIIQFLVYFVLSFNTPILNTHLDALGYTPKFISLTIAMVSITYALTIPFVQIFTKFLQRRGILFIGISLTMLGTLLTGVTSETDTHRTSAFVLVGTAIFGIGLALTTIPVMPEIYEGIEQSKNYGKHIDKRALENNLSGYFVVSQALGESFGPLISSLLEIRFDFRPT